MRVALFTTWLVDGLFPEVGTATTAVLERLGCEIEFPVGPDLLRADAREHGYPREALPLARNYVETFTDYDTVVVPDGSCAGAIRHRRTRSCAADSAALLR
jgi:L-lactate dehydrogenase complex protein LldE